MQMTQDTLLPKLNKFCDRMGFQHHFKLVDEDAYNAYFELPYTEYGVSLDKEDGQLYAYMVKFIGGDYWTPPDQDLVTLRGSKYPEDVCEAIFTHMVQSTKDDLAMENSEF